MSTGLGKPVWTVSVTPRAPSGQWSFGLNNSRSDATKDGLNKKIWVAYEAQKAGKLDTVMRRQQPSLFRDSHVPDDLRNTLILYKYRPVERPAFIFDQKRAMKVYERFMEQPFAD